MVTLIWALFFLCLFSSAMSTLTIEGKSFVNNDFMSMPSTYNVSNARFIKAVFVKGSGCRLDTTLNVKGAILYIQFVDAAVNNGCRFYEDVIEDIKTMDPLVSVFTSLLPSDDVGDAYDYYGELWAYSNSGLSLTLLGVSARIKVDEILKSAPATNASITHFVGTWVVFLQSPSYAAYRFTVVTLYGLVFLYIVGLLVMTAVMKRDFVANSTVIYLLSAGAALFRALQSGLETGILGARPTWIGNTLFWTGYIFAYAAFVHLGQTWIRIAANLNPYRWQRKLAQRLSWAAYYTIAHFTLTAVIVIVHVAYPLNVPLQTASSVFFGTLSPLLFLMSLAILCYGVQLVVALRRSIGGFNESARRASLRISTLMISTVVGFLIVAIGAAFDATDNRTILLVLANFWVRDMALLWMLISVLVSLTLHRPSFSGKGSATSKDVSDDTPNLNLETMRKELEVV